MNDFWVFGYGSLMWNPGFIYDHVMPGRIYGYHRSLCIYSHHYRGTPEFPGLVLGLNRGGCCDGLAFHVTEQNAKKTYEYLIEREQVNSVYIEKQRSIYLQDKSIVKGLFFVADETHEQYAGKLGLKEMVEIVRRSSGIAGTNSDYVLNTIDMLREKGIQDTQLEKLATYLTPIV